MPRHEEDATTGRLSPEEVEAVSLKVLRQQFLAQPADKRAATLAYINRLTAQRPTSYLARIARIARDVYAPPTQEELQA